MEELGLSDKLKWRDTTMGFFNGNKLHPWEDPSPCCDFRLLVSSTNCVTGSSLSSASVVIAGRLSKTNLPRNGLFAGAVRPSTIDSGSLSSSTSSTNTQTTSPLRGCGLEFVVLDGPARASSRKSLGPWRAELLPWLMLSLEVFGLTGGEFILAHLSNKSRFRVGRSTGVQTASGHYSADAVICTTPTPLVSALVPDLPADWKERYNAIHNIGVICVIFKLTRSVSPHFWINVSEPDIDIPGVIEFSNLRKAGNDSIVYVPYYMPVTNKKFSWPEDRLLAEAFGCLQRINPKLHRDNIIATKVARLRYGQPICEPGFAAKIPPCADTHCGVADR